MCLNRCAAAVAAGATSPRGFLVAVAVAEAEAEAEAEEQKSRRVFFVKPVLYYV